VSEKSLRNGANHGLLVLAKALPGASGSLALERMQKKIAAAETGDILSSPGKQNGNPGYNRSPRENTQMRLRIFVQPAISQPGGKSDFQDFTDAIEGLVPNVGDTVQLSMMNSPEVVKARHFKYLDSNTLEIRLNV